MPKFESFVPRTDLGFADRRGANRFDFSFNDESEVERFEHGDRSEEPRPVRVLTSAKKASRSEV